MLRLQPRLLILISAALMLAGCSSKTDSQEPKELVNPKQASVDAPQGELLDTAKRFYLRRLHSVSRESFESLKNTYPLGPYAEFAEIKTADAHFETREYETAALLYENFVKDHPASRALPYALLMAGRSQQLAYGGLGRDTQPLEKSLQFYERLAIGYPQSPYAKSALQLKEGVIQQLMAHQRFVVDFYRRRNAEKAVTAREEQFRQQWPPVLQKLQAQQQAAAAAPAQAQASSPLLLTARRGMNAGEQATTSPAAPPRARGERHALRLISCSDDQVSIALDGRAALAEVEGFVRPQRKLSPANGRLTLRLPGAAGEAITQDCFAEQDLILTGNSVTLLSDRPATTLTLDRPPRVIIIMQ